MTSLACADVLRPAVKRHALLYNTVLVLAGSAVIALASQLAFYLPFSPVPVTCQTLAVLLVGTLLGSRKGSLSVLAYLAQGAMGLPVFAAGAGGFAYMAGPTGGYLLGFVGAAYLTGLLAEKGWDRNVFTTVLAMVSGTLVIYAFGLGWLSAYVGTGNALYMGLYPFIPGAAIKIAAASVLLPSGWKLLGKKRNIK